MSQMRVTEAIDSFLKTVPINFAEDLTSRCIGDMECQLMVTPTGGEPVYDGEKLIRNTWEVCDDTYGTYKFHHLRIPKNSMSEPYYNDPISSFPIQRHVECIGMTGWNWKKRKSMWVAFDFDAITGHAQGVGISDEALDRVREAAAGIPWVQVRKSTGGAGLHIYVFFDPEEAPKTENHSVHAALARAVLGLMEREAGFDFRGNMDVLGGNMWVWHRKINEVNEGLRVIKDYEDFCPKLPDNWRANIDVVSGRDSKVQLVGLAEDEYSSFESQTSSRTKVKLDDKHKEIETRIHEMGYSIIWIPDFQCWQTHTKAFQDLMEKYPGEYQGVFRTLSDGNEVEKPNCLAGNTKVITRQGIQEISALAGKDIEVMTSRGKWVTVPFKSYGNQDVFAVTLKHGTNTKVIKATGDHGWFVCDQKHGGKAKIKMTNRSRVTTTELEVDQILVTIQPSSTYTPSVVGTQHGAVWGDGTNGGGRTSSDLSLFGDKSTDLLKFFAEHPIGGTYDKPYLYGWLADYFATNGCVDHRGQCCLNSTSITALEHVEQICAILGIRTSPIREMTNSKDAFTEGTGYKIAINRGDLTDNFFLLTKHKERANLVKRHNDRHWVVTSVEPAGNEEVFCCTVPETGCFVLEDFILTGNCFVFPNPNGGLRLTRFGRGAREHDTWTQDGTDWTWTYFNQAPSLMESAIVYGGIEDPDKKGWIFTDFEDVTKVCDSLGDSLDLEDWLGTHGKRGRTIKLRGNKTNQLVVEMDKAKEDETPFGWIEKGNKFIRLLRNSQTDPIREEEELNFDDRVRALVDMSNEFSQWVILNEENTWVGQNKDNTRSALKVWAGNKTEDIIGKLVIRNWKIVNVPFQPEYLGQRQWNRHAPQFTMSPGENSHDHKHWDMILDHCGQDLDNVIKDNKWCREAGINCGADYLLYWIAFMLRDPYCKLPYLFFYGPQNSGKSIFHEAITLLMTKGVVFADAALRSKSDFNGELAGSVLCVVEETNLSETNSSIYDKLKSWVTSEEILIHAKYQQPYQLKNTTHWCQMANSGDFCPILPGDTRIVMLHVPMLDNIEIPKDTLLGYLKDQAPSFLRTMMDLKLPSPEGRLRLPVITTDSKREAEESINNLLDKFIHDKCFIVDGYYTPMKDFYAKFEGWITEQDRYEWTYHKVIEEFKTRDILPFGRYTGNIACIGNLSLKAPDKDKLVQKPFMRYRDRLIRKT